MPFSRVCEFLSGPRKRAAAVTFAATLCNTALVIGQGVILVPLYVSHVGPSLYGAWLASGEALVWLQAFDLGLPNILIQRIAAASGRDDQIAKSEYFWAGTAILFMVALAVVGFGLLLVRWTAYSLSDQYPDAIHLAIALTLALVAAALNIANNAVVALSRGDQDTTLQGVATVLGSIIGFVTTVVLLLHYHLGLISIALGMILRMAVLITASVAIVLRSLRTGRLLWYRPRLAVIRDLLWLTPATTLGGVGYSISSQSDAILIAAAVGTPLVPVFILTRKAADMIRSVLDTFSYATYAGFAHLSTSPEKDRAGSIASTLADSRLALATIMACTYILVNGAWMRAWVGSQFSGGLTLTFLLAVQLIVSGQGYLYNSHLRAKGHIEWGSWLLVVEAAVKIGVSLVVLKWQGLFGFALCNVAVSCAFMIVTRRWLRLSLENGVTPLPATTFLFVTLLLATSCGIAYLLRDEALLPSIGAAALVMGVAAGLLRIDRIALRVVGLSSPRSDRLHVGIV